MYDLLCIVFEVHVSPFKIQITYFVEIERCLSVCQPLIFPFRVFQHLSTRTGVLYGISPLLVLREASFQREITELCFVRKGDI